MAGSERADEYFNRSYYSVKDTELQSRPVCYAIFCREPGVLLGVCDLLALIERRCAGPVTVRGKSDGDEYRSNEIVLTIEGPFDQLVTLETEALGMLSLSAAATNMAAIVEAAGDVPVIDMSARHYPPELIPSIAVAAAVGGARGTSTRAGHAAAHAKFGIGNEEVKVGSRDPHGFYLYASIPHSLNAVYGGSSIESTAAYHERYPDVPLTVLVDFEGRERDICAEAVNRFGDRLSAVRLDVAGNRIHQGGHETPDRALEMRILSQARDRQAAMEALDRYGFGPGVTIEAAYSIRSLFDSMAAKEVSILLSGGFDLDKVRAFKAADAPMDGIGTGSWVKFAMFTSDVIRVFEDDRWVPRCKAGRYEELIEPENMPTLLQLGS